MVPEIVQTTVFARSKGADATVVMGHDWKRRTLRVVRALTRSKLTH